MKKCELIVGGPAGDNNLRGGGDEVTASLSPGWLVGTLETHQSGEEMEKIRPFLHTESWASPSRRNRLLEVEDEEIPLRFRLNIELKV